MTIKRPKSEGFVWLWFLSPTEQSSYSSRWCSTWRLLSWPLDWSCLPSRMSMLMIADGVSRNTCTFSENFSIIVPIKFCHRSRVCQEILGLQKHLLFWCNECFGQKGWNDWWWCPKYWIMVSTVQCFLSFEMYIICLSLLMFSISFLFSCILKCESQGKLGIAPVCTKYLQWSALGSIKSHFKTNFQQRLLRLFNF